MTPRSSAAPTAAVKPFSMGTSAPPPFPDTEYTQRIDRLREELSSHQVDAAVILQPRDLVYFTGIETAAQLVVPQSGDPIHLVQINLDRAQREGAISDVRPSRGLSTLRDVLWKTVLSGGRIGITLDVLPARYVQRLTAMADGLELTDVSDAVMAVRSIKSPAETDVLRSAAAVSRRSFEHARSVAVEGMCEFDLQLEMQHLERAHGADEWMSHRGWNANVAWGILCSGPLTAEISGHWMTQTGSGPSAAQPYGAGGRRFKAEDLILIDRGVVLHGYHCDEARTIVIGEPNERHRHYWSSLQAVLDAAISAIRPGDPVSNVYFAAERAAEQCGIAEYFMTKARYDFAYIGHGVGLEIDEPPIVAPRTRASLLPGMVLALEPKVIVPGWGGLTLEDMVMVTADGAERLTSSPVEPLGTGECSTEEPGVKT